MRNVAPPRWSAAARIMKRYVQVPAAACAHRARWKVRLPPPSLNPPPALRSRVPCSSRGTPPRRPKGLPRSALPRARSELALTAEAAKAKLASGSTPQGRHACYRLERS